MVKRP